MLDFPAAPYHGQIYAGSNGIAYGWQAVPGMWLAVANSNQIPPLSPTGDFYPETFGAIGDGVHDDGPALQAACNAAAVQGGGRVVLGARKYLIDSANLLLGRGVVLRGTWLALGVGADWNFLGAEPRIILNPAYSIVVNGINAGLYGLLIVRKGMVLPTTLRQAVDYANQFTGKAIIVGDPAMLTSGMGNDCWISNTFIAGFQYGIWLWSCSRYRFEYIYGDCTNGIYTTQAFDLGRVVHCHFYPFLTGNFALATYAVSNAVSNGGLIRLTTAAHVLVTGDIVTVSAVGGVPNATGRWTVTVINSTTIDLQGSTFAGAYTSGGSVFLTPYRRTGIAYLMDTRTDGATLEDCFSFGYDVGVKVVDSDFTRINNTWTDNYSATLDPTTVGIWISGTSKSAGLADCRTSAQGYNLRIDTTGTGRTNSVMVNNHTSWGSTLYSLHVNQGAALLSNFWAGTGGTVRIETGATSVSFIGGVLDSIAFSYAAGAQLASFRGVRGPTSADDTVVYSTITTQTPRITEVQFATPANNDTLIDEYRTTNSAGVQQLTARVNYRLSNVTAGAEDSQIYWTVRKAGANYLSMILGSQALAPLTNGGLTMGAVGGGWLGIYISPVLVSALPAASTYAGARYFVSDSTVVASGNFGAVVAGSGANRVPVHSDGTSWRIG